MLVVVGAVATVVAAFAYLRVALAVATTQADGEEAAAGASGSDGGVKLQRSTRRVDLCTGLVLAVAASMTLVLGVVPAVFVDWAGNAGFML